MKCTFMRPRFVDAGSMQVSDTLDGRQQLQV
jgi:hypothetical protein